MRRYCGKTVVYFLACSALALLSGADGTARRASAAVEFDSARTASVQLGQATGLVVVALGESADKQPDASEPERESDDGHNETTEKETPGSEAEAESTEKLATTDDPPQEEAPSGASKGNKKPTKVSSQPKKDDEKKSKPYKVKTGQIKIEVKLAGTFVAGEMEEVALRPEVWSRFKVLEAVEHGSRVKKGDVLVRFDDEKLEKDLSDEALDQRIAELSLMQDEEEYPRLKRMLELSFDAAKLKYERALADYEYYHSTDRPFTVEIAHFRYKSAEEQLGAAQEELDQLQKMYDADELTEETEEIVLRRQRFAVKTAELVLKLNKESRDYTLNISLPRSDESYATAKEEAELLFKQAKTALEVGLTRKSYDMEKKRMKRAQSVERHGKLLSDKRLMVLRAPTDGIVYYGQCLKGKWPQVTSLQAKLKPFGTATPNTVLMTIVKPGSLHIESTLGEKELPSCKVGLKAAVIPTADKELELAGEVTEVDSIPLANNKFSVELSVDTNQAPDWLVAGMTCDVKVVAYENKKALVVPLSLVQTDENIEKQKYVMLVTQQDDAPEEIKAVRRNVKLGRKQGKLVEVLKGLEAGDEIIKEEKKEDEE